MPNISEMHFITAQEEKEKKKQQVRVTAWDRY